jgi:uncharacterized protein YggE
MPVTSKNGSMGMGSKSGGMGMSCDGCCSSNGPHGMSKKIFWSLLCVILVFGIIYIDSLTDYSRKKAAVVGQADRTERTIGINGYGKVTGNNDIAMTTIGFSNTDKDVATAQANNKKVMDQVMADLKNLGIASRDLQTDYSIAPDYDYSGNKQELRGYQVRQQVSIKIRDLNKISNVLALAGKYGANEVGGLSFTIDDAENLRTEARMKALDDAKTKAQKLADSLGMRLGEVVSYNEYPVDNNDVYMLKNAAPLGAAMGGGGVAPAVSKGSTDVEMNVNLTYELLSR